MSEFTEDVVNTSPAARKPTIATWYVNTESVATVIKTRRMQPNMYTSDHQAKLGYSSPRSAMIELTKAINQPHYFHVSLETLSSNVLA